MRVGLRGRLGVRVGLRAGKDKDGIKEKGEIKGACKYIKG